VGKRNFLVEGVSGSGKTSVAIELQRRGHQVVHGDRQLKYVGDPVTGEPLPVPGAFPDVHSRAEWIHRHLCWPVNVVESLVGDRDEEVTFFCGGCRNAAQLLHLFDAVFVLDVDRETLGRRLEERPEDEWAGRGRRAERDLVLRLHQTAEDLPDGIRIDATRPLPSVVDDILSHCEGPQGWVSLHKSGSLELPSQTPAGRELPFDLVSAEVDEPVHVEEWDPAWQTSADAMVAECRAVLGEQALAVEHIGSTAVPGLAAKPIIDVMIGVPPGCPTAVAKQLAMHGWAHLGEAGVRGREYLRRRARQHANVHVVEHGSALWQENLALREYLRRDADARRRYAAAKRQAAQEAPNLLAYSKHKAAVVAELVKEAKHA
jgi:GrpB-like predicted nucleotidyltransferase (UPF0157 family)